MSGTAQGDQQNGVFMPKIPTSDLYILTGERSGESYAAAVLRHVSETHPHIRCKAMGGSELRKAGADVCFDSQGFDVMGYVAVLRDLRTFIRRRNDLLRDIEASRPKVVLSVDYPGMNMNILKRLGKQDWCTRLHVVAPQVWAWRPGRAKKYAQSCDRLACFFPFEPAYFTPYGCRADFIGHPMVDLIAETDLQAPLPPDLTLDSKQKLLLLAPGSRVREVSGLLPVFDAAARRLQQLLQAQGESCSVVIAAAENLDDAAYRQHSDFPLLRGSYRQLCARAHLGMIASGTATLEAALIGLPHVVCYQSDPASAAIARHLLQTPHIALPNIIHAQRVVPELLQKELNPERLSLHALGLWQGERRQQCLEMLGKTTEKLGGCGAMRKLANLVCEELER